VPPFVKSKDFSRQDKVHEELHRIFGDSGRAATSRDLREMQYLELCIKEAMRMFPVAPIIARHLTGDVALCKYRCATSREVTGYIPDEIVGSFN
jgi:cytochrome P450 family 4